MDANYLVRAIYNIAKRLDDMKIFKHTFPFNNTEMEIMKEIVHVKEEGGRIISSDLAKELGVTRSAVSQIVNKLEKQNVVRRVPDERDRKIAYIELSESARGIYEKIKDEINRVMGEIIAKLGEKKVQDFIDYADEFVGAFDAAVSKCEKIDFTLPAADGARA